MPPHARESKDETGHTDAFERHRAELTGLAYRMLGSLSEAEDVLQEAYLRWRAVTAGSVAEPRAFLHKVVARLCLDQLKSARARRERYVGTWLPEPLVGESAGVVQARSLSELAQDLSYALLLTLDRLTPAERAAFLLHDVFELEFSEIAAVVGHTEASCRQLAVRARAHLQAARPRFRPTVEQGQQLVAAFFTAAASGDTDALRQLCAEEAVLLSDGGGRVSAALKPIRGPDRIARFMVGGARKFAHPQASFRVQTVNGLPGLVITTPAGVVQTFAFELDDQRKVVCIYTTRNPDKLRSVPT